jgi:hypothetical protein
MLLGTLLGALAVGAALASAPSGVEPESRVERLHRQGVYCMEELERAQCAIDLFEQLLDERTNERELVTDAMLRLVKLYQQEERPEDVAPVTRRFWDVGMKHRSRGHVPYSTRFFPSQLDVLMMVHVGRIANAPISKRLGPEATEFLFTCSEVRRNEIVERWRWERAERKAAEEGKQTVEILYEEQDRAREAEERRENDRDGARERDRGEPVFVVAACPVVEALGQADMLAVTRGVAALNHADFRMSMGVMEIPDLDALLRDAEKRGTIERRGDARWALPELAYYDDEIQLARLDRNELTIAPSTFMRELVDARERRKRRLDRQLDTLIGRVPRDTGFFLVMTEVAMRELAFGEMGQAKRDFWAMLLPRPRGLQVAGVFHEYFGLFTRMPTATPVKAKMLVNLARLMIDGEREQDDDAELLRNLDVAEATDGRALLLSYVLSPEQLQQVMDQGQ